MASCRFVLCGWPLPGLLDIINVDWIAAQTVNSYRSTNAPADETNKRRREEQGYLP